MLLWVLGTRLSLAAFGAMIGAITWLIMFPIFSLLVNLLPKNSVEWSGVLLGTTIGGVGSVIMCLLYVTGFLVVDLSADRLRRLFLVGWRWATS
jgi:hypothetical protein